MRENYRTALVEVLWRRHPTDLPDQLTCMRRINQISTVQTVRAFQLKGF